jgi:hypothetical protein
MINKAMHNLKAKMNHGKEMYKIHLNRVFICIEIAKKWKMKTKRHGHITKNLHR